MSCSSRHHCHRRDTLTTIVFVIIIIISSRNSSSKSSRSSSISVFLATFAFAIAIARISATAAIVVFVVNDPTTVSVFSMADYNRIGCDINGGSSVEQLIIIVGVVK